MEKQLTPLEAFNDFLAWVHESGKWQELDRKERNRIITARRDRDGKREGLGLGYARLKDILQTYAPGRYEFNETVILKDGTS